MNSSCYLLLLLWSVSTTACTELRSAENAGLQPTHQDVPFLQDYSIKYYLPAAGESLHQVFCDRNGVVQVLSSTGLMKPHQGSFLYPGTLLADKTYLPMTDKQIAAMTLYRNQFVYLDQEAVLSNAWAGKIFAPHQMPGAQHLAAGKSFDFLLSAGSALQYLTGGEIGWQGQLQDEVVLDIKYDTTRSVFWLLGHQSLHIFSPAEKSLRTLFRGQDFTCFEVPAAGKEVLIGTNQGYIQVDAATGKQTGMNRNLPCLQLTCIREINGSLWFGSAQGAFMRRKDGKFNYYHGERWLPGEQVRYLAAGPNLSVLVLTDKGLGQICFQQMSLQEKALFFEEQVRRRHIRYGFNAALSGMEKGNINTGRLSDSDNDGLWTAMYLGAQVFRYASTRSEEALENCREALDAMERLYTIHPVAGFPARSFARSGYIAQLADPERWQHAPDPGWDWKATTSSDEAIGHIFAFGVMAELIDVPDLRQKSIRLIDTLMSHILRNDLYLVDYDGKPTTWGRWNPAYVNALPKMVGDRKINSSNIIAMLQTAYYFTRKEVYKQKAFELMQQHGYLENLMRPMRLIGPAPATADAHSRMLSASWNHSDDEMYFLGYWGLYRYAFNDTLRVQYKKTILDHWQAERPEKEGAWNIFTAITGVAAFDLEEATWYLQEYPLDLIHWDVENSHRQDISLLAPNFRNQTTTEVLPPDELKISRHNANRFILDGGSGGRVESSAGDIWLLPYWMGRYLQVIQAPPVQKTSAVTRTGP